MWTSEGSKLRARACQLTNAWRNRTAVFSIALGAATCAGEAHGLANYTCGPSASTRTAHRQPRAIHKNLWAASSINGWGPISCEEPNSPLGCTCCMRRSAEYDSVLAVRQASVIRNGPRALLARWLARACDCANGLCSQFGRSCDASSLRRRHTSERGQASAFSKVGESTSQKCIHQCNMVGAPRLPIPSQSTSNLPSPAANNVLTLEPTTKSYEIKATNHWRPCCAAEVSTTIKSARGAADRTMCIAHGAANHLGGMRRLRAVANSIARKGTRKTCK